MQLEVVREKLKKEYGILCQRLFPHPELETPFGATWCEVEPHGSTLPHDHHEGECFFIFKGSGRMRMGDHEWDVQPGSVIGIPAHTNHVLKNESDEAIVFLSVWWEKPGHSEVPRRALTAVAPPTPNGNLHVGHLSGPYLAAEVYHRYLRLRGSQSSFVSGTDDHQSYVVTKGVQLGCAPDDVVTRFRSEIRNTLARFQSEFDTFLFPREDAAYQQFVQQFYATLVEKGHIVEKERESLFCRSCDQILFEAHVKGGCPHCQSPTQGQGCENCGQMNDGVDLIEPHCVHCDAAPVSKMETRAFFALEPFRDALVEKIHTSVTSPRLQAFLKTVFEKPLPEVSASFSADWGIPIEASSDGKVIYEWVEMAAGYLYLAQKNGFKSGEPVDFTLAFGFDNSFFYTTLIPALLMAYEPGGLLPSAFLVNEFYQLEGKKFSTSRNHAIWGDAILESIPADVLRFFLALDRSETAPTSFSMDNFARTIDRVWVQGLEPWLAALDKRVVTVLDGRFPESFSPSASDKRVLQRCETELAQIAGAYSTQNFSLKEVARRIETLIYLARAHGESQAHLNLPESVATELLLVRNIAMAALPILPQFGNSVFEKLGLGEGQWQEADQPLRPGQTVAPLETDFFSRALEGILRFQTTQ